MAKRDPKRLGAAVKAARVKLGLSQAEFAQRGELGIATVQRVERGEVVPWGKTLKKFDLAADMDEGWASRVLEGSEPATPEPQPEPDQAALVPLSADWWLELRRRLSPEMFAQTAELIHRAQKAAEDAERRRDNA